MKKNIPIMQVFVAVFALAYPWGKIAADTVINIDTTQEGGNLTVDTPVLIVSDANSDPTLTLTDGAQGQWSGSSIIGNLNGETGNLAVSAGSSLVTTGSNQFLGTYGGLNVFSGSAYLGLNTGAVGTAAITGENSISDFLIPEEIAMAHLRVDQERVYRIFIPVSGWWKFCSLSVSSKARIARSCTGLAIRWMRT